MLCSNSAIDILVHDPTAVTRLNEGYSYDPSTVRL